MSLYTQKEENVFFVVVVLFFVCFFPLCPYQNSFRHGLGLVSSSDVVQQLSSITLSCRSLYLCSLEPIYPMQYFKQSATPLL